LKIVHAGYKEAVEMNKVVCSIGDNIHEIIDKLPPEGTLVLTSGTWDVNLIIKRSINIMGERDTILNGSEYGCVIKIDEPGLKVALSNLTIYGGMSEVGAGIRLSDNSEVTVEHCVIRNNSAVRSGGGVFASRGSLLLVDSIFNQNSAQVGGGINTASTATVKIMNCMFFENAAEIGAGAYVSDGSQIEISKCKFKDNQLKTHWSVGRDIYIAGTMTRQPMVVVEDTTLDDCIDSVSMGAYYGSLTLQKTKCAEAIKYIDGFVDGGQNDFYESKKLEPLTNIYLDQYDELLSQLFDRNGNFLLDTPFDEHLKPLAGLGVLRVLPNNNVVLLKGVDEIFSVISQIKTSILFLKAEFNISDTTPRKQADIFVHYLNGKIVEHHVSSFKKHWYTLIESKFDAKRFSSYLTNNIKGEKKYLGSSFTLSLPETKSIFEKLPFVNNVPDLKSDNVERVAKIIIGLQSMVIVAVKMNGEDPLPIGLALLNEDGLFVIKLKVNKNKVTFIDSSIEELYMETQRFKK